MEKTEVTVYDAAGGRAGLVRLARALHDRCLADPVLSHPFGKPDQHPEHLERLAAYLGEVLGGPAAYTQRGGSQTSLMRMHLGEGGATQEYRARFVACFDAAVRDTGLDHDPELRDTLHDYLVWAAQDLMPDHDDPRRAPSNLPVPRWGWAGLAPQVGPTAGGAAEARRRAGP